MVRKLGIRMISLEISFFSVNKKVKVSRNRSAGSDDKDGRPSKMRKH
jgi:hypothetical protein